jgi:UDPglucose 6-dehydrogenase
MTTRIAMVGTGYVGLVTGACFAELGHRVACVDNDPRKIDMLLAGRIPIYEPGLEEIVARNVAQGRLGFSLDLAAAVAACDAVFIAVGTPAAPATGKADLGYVRAAAIEIAQALTKDTVVIVKSTVPVGTNREIEALMAPHLRPGVTAHVASNPEFLREGAAIADFMEPDRIVVGVESPAALKVMQAIYAPLVAQDVPLLVTTVGTAQMIKYAANAFLAVKVSYINEIADLCEAVGADVEVVARGIGLDNRIGPSFLKTGPGWGGSCLPKDTLALQAVAEDARTQVAIVEAAIDANNRRKSAMARRIVRIAGGDVAGKDMAGKDMEGRTIALLGLTFKGQTDDMRQSPAIDIARELMRAGARVAAYDPSQPHDAARLLPGVTLAASAVEAAAGADAVALVTDWKSFRSLDFSAIAAAMRTPVMIDLRNFLDEGLVRAAGFTAYHRLGKGG